MINEIFGYLSARENILTGLACFLSVACTLISGLSLRTTLRSKRILSQTIKNQYIRQYKRGKRSRYTDSQINSYLIKVLKEIESDIYKIESGDKRNIITSEIQQAHISHLKTALEKIDLEYKNISISTKPLEQPSEIGRLRYLEKITKEIMNIRSPLS